jgi:hypothetical protein
MFAMIEVIPLKYGAAFKRIFSQPDVFSRFAQDVLGMELKFDKVYTGYEYPEQCVIVEIQHVKKQDFFDRFLYYHLISMAEQVHSFSLYRFERTVFTIVVLTSVTRDGSCAVSDFNPTDERGNRVAVYPHRLVFLSPPAIRRWLDFIADSLDGKIEEMRQQKIDPAVLAEIKDESAWEEAKELFKEEGRARGDIGPAVQDGAASTADGHGCFRHCCAGWAGRG